MRKRQSIMRRGARIIEYMPHRMREKCWNDCKQRKYIKHFRDN